jgi:hypothetical protein
MKKNSLIFVTFFSLCALTAFPSAATAQRDFLTPEEVELVRENQVIDQRISVLVQAIDRRFQVLNLDVSAPKVKTKGEWGNLPEGTRAELMLDIRRILQKAVDDIDSLAERPESAIMPDPDAKKKNDSSFATLFPRAVRSLAAAAERYSPVLRKELDTSANNDEKGSIMVALDLCQEIIASVIKLPAEPPKKTGKKT